MTSRQTNLALLGLAVMAVVCPVVAAPSPLGVKPVAIPARAGRLTDEERP